jgi:hypothetical protein
MNAACFPPLILFETIVVRMYGEEYMLCSPLCNFFQSDVSPQHLVLIYSQHT